MITKFIRYREISSKDLGLRLVDDVRLTSPERDVEVMELAGRDGGLVHDRKRLGLVTYSLPFVLYDQSKSVEETLNALNAWLLSGQVTWSDFEKSWDTDYLYKAIYHETFRLEGTVRGLKKCVLTFKLHPIKYLKTGMNRLSLTNGMTLTNPLSRPSKPLIKLIGTGDVTLTIGTQLLRLRGVSGHIILDCDTETASYDNKEPQYDKVYSYPFPKLLPGANRISWDNSRFRVEMIPRWEEVVT